MEPLNLIAKLEEATTQRKALVIPGTDFDRPAWDDIIAVLNEQYSTPSEHKEVPGKHETIINNIIIHIDFYIRINQIWKLKQTEAVSDWLSNALQANVGTQSGMINFTSFPHEVPVHNDPRVMIYWQCLGEVEWKIYGDDPKSEPVSHILKPGDIVIVPTGVFHGVFPFQPRAGITFSIWE